MMPRPSRNSVRPGLLIALALVTASQAHADQITVPVEITSDLKHPNTPLSVRIDLASHIREARLQGHPDINSLRVINLETGQPVPSARTEDFLYGNTGRLEWVIADPRHRRFEVRFQTTTKRQPPRPQGHVPAIGVGDLLRYNAGPHRPITAFFQAELHDLTGDGHLDIVGSWNYAYRDGDPWAAPICYPGIDPARPTQFGNLQRLRFFDPASPDDIQEVNTAYSAVDCLDLDGDGRLDLVHLDASRRRIRLLLGTNRRQPGGCPIFKLHSGLAAPAGFHCQAVDLDGDDDIDLIIGRNWIENISKTGWPIQPAAPRGHGLAAGCTFADLDNDGQLDAIQVAAPRDALLGGPLVWRRSLDPKKLKFGEARPVDGVQEQNVTMVGVSRVSGRSMLVIQHKAFQDLILYRQAQARSPSKTSPGQAARFERLGRAESPDAVLSLSDQAWPCLCDWDQDGDQDLLIGGGYGWPRIVLNEGTDSRPRYATPKKITVDGRPIRFQRNSILGPPNSTHNMGYPYPVLTDWNADGRLDLVCPNETNRIFWFPNLATQAGPPKWGARRQVVCEGFPDSAERKTRSAKTAASSDSNNGIYPREPDRPFMWRTGAAIADFTGDGLVDLVTCEGSGFRATLFVQSRSRNGRLTLKRHSAIRLKDGREFTGEVVERGAKWAESYRPVDWNRDGLVDLVYSTGGSHHGTRDGGSIYLLINVGTRTKPVFASPRTMRCYGRPIKITNHGPHPWVGDYDGDGRPDLIACVEWSVYPYYSHAALEMPAPPTIQIGPGRRIKPSEADRSSGS